jgi:regulator of RNase E activity RraA
VRARIAGRIVTVKLGPSDPATRSTRHLGTAAIESAERGEVIVVEQSTGIDAAAWGGVLSNAAQLKGLAGVIVEGPARDIDEALELGFPVYARAVTCRTARGRVQELATGGPLLVGGVSVANGDYVLADSSGIVFLPAERASAILEAAEAIAAREAAMTRELRAGADVSRVMGASYESMLKT